MYIRIHRVALLSKYFGILPKNFRSLNFILISEQLILEAQAPWCLKVPHVLLSVVLTTMALVQAQVLLQLWHLWIKHSPSDLILKLYLLWHTQMLNIVIGNGLEDPVHQGFLRTQRFVNPDFLLSILPPRSGMLSRHSFDSVKSKNYATSPSTSDHQER